MNKLLIGIAFGAVCTLSVILFQFSFTAPFRAARAYYDENRVQLERLVSECRAAHVSGRVEAETAPESIRTILDSLPDKYPKNNPSPKVSTVSVTYDNDGDMKLSLNVWCERTHGDGYNQPDLFCVNLIYLDDGCDADTRITSEKPFAGNWYTWSHNTYSG